MSLPDVEDRIADVWEAIDISPPYREARSLTMLDGDAHRVFVIDLPEYKNIPDEIDGDLIVYAEDITATLVLSKFQPDLRAIRRTVHEEIHRLNSAIVLNATWPASVPPEGTPFVAEARSSINDKNQLAIVFTIRCRAGEPPGVS